MKTMVQLRARALNAIERKETVYYDVIADTGQLVGNVDHMEWFITAVMRQLTQDVKCYAHLEVT